MKARLHKGTFKESMKTMKEIGNSIEDVVKYFSIIMVEDEGIDCFLCKSPDQYSFTQVGIDDRLGWQAPTYLVNFEGWGVVGMVSQMPVKKSLCKVCFNKDGTQKEYTRSTKKFGDYDSLTQEQKDSIKVIFCTCSLEKTRKENRKKLLNDRLCEMYDEIYIDFKDIVDSVQIEVTFNSMID